MIIPLITVTAVLTAYSPLETCKTSCVDASGGRPQHMTTVACPRKYPLGTIAIVSDINVILICTDRTSKKYDGRWDIFMDDYEEALRFGKRTKNITIFTNL